MAQLNVDHKVFADHRFQCFGRLIGGDKWTGLGRMIFLWNACLEHQTYHLNEADLLDLHPDIPDIKNHLINSGLGRVEDEGIYICGTHGRIEWLGTLRANGKYGKRGKTFGKQGGRPPKKKTPSRGLLKPPQGGEVLNPPSSSVSTSSSNTDLLDKEQEQVQVHGAEAPPVAVKLLHGEFKNVLLKPEEYEKLRQKHPDGKADTAIAFLDAKLESKKDAHGKLPKTYQYGSHYAVLHEGSWVWLELAKAGSVKLPPGGVAVTDADRAALRAWGEKGKQGGKK